MNYPWYWNIIASLIVGFGIGSFWLIYPALAIGGIAFIVYWILLEQNDYHKDKKWGGQ